MNVRMPDGTIIRNVPEGTSKADLERKYNASRALADPRELLMSESEMGRNFEAALIGAGRTLHRAKLGAQRLFAGDERDQEIQAEAAEDTRLTKSLRGEFPISSFIGETAPTLAVPGGATLKGGLAINAGLGLLQPEGDQIQNAAISGATGLAFQGAGRTVQKFIGGSDRAAAKATNRAARKVAGKTAMERAKELGVDLPERVRSGSSVAANAEAIGRTNAFTAGAFDAADNRLDDGLIDQALKRFGRAGRELDEVVLDDIEKEIGEQFDAFVDVGLKKLKPSQHGAALADETLEAFEGAVTLGAPEAALESAHDLVEAALDGALEPRQSWELLQKFRRFARTARNQQVESIADFYDALQNQLMDGMEGGSAFAKKTLRKLRRDWRDIQILKDPGVVKDGRIQYGILNGRLERSKFTKKAYNAGKETSNSLWEVGRLGEQLQRLKVGSPGTAKESANVLSSIAQLPLAIPAAGQTLPPAARAIVGEAFGRGTDAASRAAALKAGLISGESRSRGR